jgi:hypothetical protein
MPGFYNDTRNADYKSVLLTVGTTEVEAKVGGSRLADRQGVWLYNDSSNTVYVGPTGVTTSGSTKGLPLLKNQATFLELPDFVAVFVIAGSAGNSVICQEIA